MKRITLERRRVFYGAVRALRLFVDDVFVGEVRQGDRLVLSVENNARSPVGKMDWGKTKPFDLLQIKDGDRVTAKSWFTLNPLRNMAILFTLPIQFEQTEGE